MPNDVIIKLEDVSTVYEGERRPAIKAETDDLHNQVTIFQITTSLAVVVAAVEAVLLYAKRKKK